MGQPRFEVPTGAVDGVNTVYYVSLPYVAGSTAVWLNGILLERTLDDGWTESDPSTGEITLKEAPQGSGACPDVIQVFFKDTTEDAPETVVEVLVGTIEEDAGISGVLVQSENVLIGTIGSDTILSGVIQNDVPSDLQGIIEAESQIIGLVEEC